MLTIQEECSVIKKYISIGILLCVVFFVCGCSSKITAQILLVEDDLHNGDAKFFADKVATNVDNNLRIYSMDGSFNEYDVPVNWIDVVSEERVLVYGNFENEVGIVHFDSDWNMTRHDVIFKNENLNIDPAIIKIDSTYYLTLTEIIGTVNNADINQPNGNYTIKLYSSEDLIRWNYVTDVTSSDNNLEDVKLISDNGKLGIMYEKEVVDKGDSSICFIESVGDTIGTSWSEEIILMDRNADHEPANIMKSENGYIVFYSSDKEHPGESYMGAGMYYAVFDQDFNIIEKDIRISCDVNGGLLLYDVKLENGALFYIASEDYLTNCNLVVLKSDRIDDLKK